MENHKPHPINIDRLLQCMKQCQQEAGGVMLDRLPALTTISNMLAITPNKLLLHGFDRAYRLWVEGV